MESEVRIVTLEIYRGKVVAKWADKDMSVDVTNVEEEPSESGCNRIDRLNFEVVIEYGDWIDPNEGRTEIGR